MERCLTCDGTTILGEEAPYSARFDDLAAVDGPGNTVEATLRRCGRCGEVRGTHLELAYRTDLTPAQWTPAAQEQIKRILLQTDRRIVRHDVARTGHVVVYTVTDA